MVGLVDLKVLIFFLWLENICEAFIDAKSKKAGACADAIHIRFQSKYLSWSCAPQLFNHPFFFIYEIAFMVHFCMTFRLGWLVLIPHASATKQRLLLFTEESACPALSLLWLGWVFLPSSPCTPVFYPGSPSCCLVALTELDMVAMGSPMALLCWKGVGGVRGITFRQLPLCVAMGTDAEVKYRLSHCLIFYSSNSWVLKEWPSASVCNRRSVYIDIQQIGIICIRSVLYEVLLHFGNVQTDWNHN